MMSNDLVAPRPALLGSFFGASLALALLASPARADVPPPPPACASAGAPCRYTTSGVMGFSTNGSCLEACDGAFFCDIGGSCYPAFHQGRPFDRWAPPVPCSSLAPPAPAPSASAPAPVDAPSPLSALAVTLIVAGVVGIGVAGVGGLALARRRPEP